jgi:hypothetical protein
LAVIFLFVAVFGEWFATTRQPAAVPLVQDALPPSGFPPGLGGGGGGSDAPEEPREEKFEAQPEAESRGEAPLLDSAAPTEEAAAALLAPSETPLPTATLIPTPTPPPTEKWSLWELSLMRVLQISLALLAVGAGLAAFALRRSAGGS